MAIQHQAARSNENFPVASRLLPVVARRDILALYDFARGADDIADHETMPAEDRLAALEALQSALANHQKNRLPPWALPYYERVQQGYLPARYGDALLEAFCRDCRQTRYETIEDLLDYCRLSAAPVGQAVLQLCQETNADLKASDAVCTVLQLTNHLQDVQSDYQKLNRIYLPQSWLRTAGLQEDELAKTQTSPSLRGVFDQLLDVCDALLAEARPLPRTIASRRLRLEVAIIQAIATKLVQKLRRHDPLAGRVSLSTTDKLCCLAKGLRML